MAQADDATPRAALADIELGPNFRRELTDLDELADSIRSMGVLQALLVERCRGGYRLVAGYRRYRAAEMAGEATVPIAVVGANLDARTVNLVENLHRVELSAIEQGEALVEMSEDGTVVQRELARRTGIPQPRVSKLISYATKLHPEVREAVHTGKLTLERAGHMLNQPHEVQLRMLATGPAQSKAKGRTSEAEAALRRALDSFLRGEEDAALINARQAVHELERRQRDGRTRTPRHSTAPTSTSRDRAERATIAKAAGTRTGHGTNVKITEPAGVVAPLPPFRPLGGGTEEQRSLVEAPVSTAAWRPKVKCQTCRMFHVIVVGSDREKTLEAHYETSKSCKTAQSRR